MSNLNNVSYWSPAWVKLKQHKWSLTNLSGSNFEFLVWAVSDLSTHLSFVPSKGWTELKNWSQEFVVWTKCFRVWTADQDVEVVKPQVWCFIQCDSRKRKHRWWNPSEVPWGPLILHLLIRSCCLHSWMQQVQAHSCKATQRHAGRSLEINTWPLWSQRRAWALPMKACCYSSRHHEARRHQMTTWSNLHVVWDPSAAMTLCSWRNCHVGREGITGFTQVFKNWRHRWREILGRSCWV